GVAFLSSLTVPIRQVEITSVTIRCRRTSSHPRHDPYGPHSASSQRYSLQLSQPVRYRIFVEGD
ncbi:MAG: hypothetical protein VB858_22455, partial [Planctomycetaceae bacterium]